MSASFEVDANLGVAYLQFSDAAVAETVELSPDVQVDVDATGAVVGVEILDLDVEIPTVELVNRFGLSTEQQIAMIRARTALRSFNVMSTSTTGSVEAQLQPA